jgi:site-specific recombinase XerD
MILSAGFAMNDVITNLAVEGNVAAATQNQALSALLFLYRYVLDDPMPWIHDIVRARRPLRLPVVLTPEDVRKLIEQMDGVPKLVALLRYGGELRLLWNGLM